MTAAIELPTGVSVFERGWLSSNNILLQGADRSSLIDSGYCSHAAQTLALVQHALAGQPLHNLVNTHLHSDHCGGNALLQASYPQLRTYVPPGLAQHVRQWDATALSYTPTGQQCPPFALQEVIAPGQELFLGSNLWQVHSAPGHDPHAVMLFEPVSRTLVSGDALWENGFGVVFPELEGESAFDEVAASLDVIESLRPRLVIPGHGRPFRQAATAVARARARLDGFIAQPQKHALYAAKVLLKFKLLELQRVPLPALQQWVHATPYFELVRQRYFANTDADTWLADLIADLQRSGAARREDDVLLDAGS